MLPHIVLPLIIVSVFKLQGINSITKAKNETESRQWIKTERGRLHHVSLALPNIGTRPCYAYFDGAYRSTTCRDGINTDEWLTAYQPQNDADDSFLADALTVQDSPHSYNRFVRTRCESIFWRLDLDIQAVKSVVLPFKSLKSAGSTEYVRKLRNLKKKLFREQSGLSEILNRVANYTTFDSRSLIKCTHSAHNIHSIGLSSCFSTQQFLMHIFKDIQCPLLAILDEIGTKFQSQDIRDAKEKVRHVWNAQLIHAEALCKTLPSYVVPKVTSFPRHIPFTGICMTVQRCKPLGFQMQSIDGYLSISCISTENNVSNKCPDKVKISNSHKLLYSSETIYVKNSSTDHICGIGLKIRNFDFEQLIQLQIQVCRGDLSYPPDSKVIVEDIGVGHSLRNRLLFNPNEVGTRHGNNVWFVAAALQLDALKSLALKVASRLSPATLKHCNSST